MCPAAEATATCAHDDTWLDLADAVDLLRRQVVEAQRRGAGSAVRFEIDTIDVELELELSRTRGGVGELRFGVIGANGKAERSSRRTHRVSLTLKPRTRDGGDVEVRDIDEY
ncbi:trypco2 family protein [Streptomyces sp. NPDC006463]|uniref:trypco2 family protein n=1 Tax=Streptomyces sp. NPDC006463 TaxID=3364746 RepID=UPI0036766E64